MDWEQIKKNIAPLYKQFDCSCGGQFAVSGQALCICPETKKLVDMMTYTCNKCGKQTNQSFEVPHLNKPENE